MVEKRLRDLDAGEKGEVTRVGGSGALRRRIMDMGIVRGAKIELVREMLHLVTPWNSF